METLGAADAIGGRKGRNIKVSEAMILSGLIPMTSSKKTITVPLLIIMLYFFADYLRPEYLDAIRPGIIALTFLSLFLIKNGYLTLGLFKDQYIKLFFFILLQMTVLGILGINNYVLKINNHWAFLQLQIMLFYWIISLSICLFVDNIAKVKVLLTVYIIMMTIPALSQVFLGYRSLGSKGFMGDLNDFALAMVVVIPLSYFLGLSYRGYKRIAYWAMAVIQILATGSATSRGGFIGMLAVTALCWLQSKKRLVLSFALMTVAIAYYLYIPRDFLQEISVLNEATHEATGQDRIELWKVAWRIFLSSPIIGTGQGNIQILVPDFQYDPQGISYWGDRNLYGRAVHSTYFTMLPELGMIGGLLWGMMIYNIFKKYREITRKMQEKDQDLEGNDNRELILNMTKGLAIGMVGYLVSGIFLSAFYYPHFWNLAAIITTLHLITQADFSSGDRKSEFPERMN